MWEVCAQVLPYDDQPGVKHNPILQLPPYVCGGGRPTMALLPEDVPVEMRLLIEDCWNGEFRLRPTMAVVYERLLAMPLGADRTSIARVYVDAVEANLLLQGTNSHLRACEAVVANDVQSLLHELDGGCPIDLAQEVSA